LKHKTLSVSILEKNFMGKTNRRISYVSSILIIAAVILSACSPAATTVAPTDTPVPVAAATDTVAAPAVTDTTAATMAVTDTPAATMAATTAATTAAAGSGKIAILLPENTTARYESQDLPLIKAKLAALGFDVANNLIYSNAQQNAADQQSQAEAAITNGASVLVLDPVDASAAAVITDEAKAKNIPVVSYDRLVQNSDGVSYYISFDNKKVGTLQGQALLDALTKAGKTNPTIVMINGDPADPNAALFKAGAHSVLDGKVTIGKEYDTPNWLPANAQTEMTQALTALNNKVDGVYAANDGTASGAVAAMIYAGINPLPPITGQDAELAGIQRILAGQQYMTIYKAIKPEAEDAATIAYDLVTGATPDASMITGTTNNGKTDVKSVILTPVVVTISNIESTVVADGFWTAAQICTADFAAACTANNIK
jgi:D-xylose transport system substrate-binding protein